MWQKCPICNGEGEIMNISNYVATDFMYDTCSVCNGKKIISQITGLPPDYEQNEKERENENIPHNLGNTFPSVITKQKAHE